MTWNWQRPDWPNFRWQRTRLEAAEKQFLVSGGVFVGSVRHLVKEERNQLTIEAMSTEAVTTSEIEGEILDRASVQSSLRKQLAGVYCGFVRQIPKSSFLCSLRRPVGITHGG